MCAAVSPAFRRMAAASASGHSAARSLDPYRVRNLPSASVVDTRCGAAPDRSTIEAASRVSGGVWFGAGIAGVAGIGDGPSQEPGHRGAGRRAAPLAILAWPARAPVPVAIGFLAIGARPARPGASHSSGTRRKFRRRVRPAGMNFGSSRATCAKRPHLAASWSTGISDCGRGRMTRIGSPSMTCMR